MSRACFGKRSKRRSERCACSSAGFESGLGMDVVASPAYLLLLPCHAMSKTLLVADVTGQTSKSKVDLDSHGRDPWLNDLQYRILR
eukprot:s1207_g23.t1